MNRIRCAGFLLASVLAGPLPAQEPTEAPDSKKQSAPETTLSQPSTPDSTSTSEVRRDPNQKPGFGHDPMVDRRIAAFVRLREMMFDQVKLDVEKRKKIDTMFDDYMAGLLNPAFFPHSQPKNEDYATPQELPELRQQLDAAEKAGDKEKIESLNGKIYAAHIALEPHVVDEPIFFFNYVYAELNERQKRQLDPVIDRWRLLRVAELAPDNDYKQLRRAVRDPLLNRSEEVGKKLDDIIVEGFRSVPFEERNDQSVMTQLANQTKPRLLELLDSAQKDQLEKTLVMLEEWEKADVEVARKTRERLKNHRPTPVAGQLTRTVDPSRKTRTTPDAQSPDKH